MARTVRLDDVDDLTGNDAEIDAIQADIGAGADTSTLGDIYNILGNPATSITDQLTALGIDVGTAASASTLGSLYGILGNPNIDLSTTIGFIWAIAKGLLVLTETGGTLTTDGTVQNIYINNTPAGVFKPECFQMDFTNQTAAETLVLRLNYRIKSGGNLIEEDTRTFTGVQDPPLKTIYFQPNRFGLSVSGEKTGGANKAYDWGVLYKV